MLCEQFEFGHLRGSSHGAAKIHHLSYADPDYVKLSLNALSLWQRIEDESQVDLIDPEFSICDAYGITHAPSLLYLRQDTSAATLVQGFDLDEWVKATSDIAKSLRWTSPQLSKFRKVAKQNYLVK